MSISGKLSAAFLAALCLSPISFTDAANVIEVRHAIVDTGAFPIPYAGKEEIFHHKLYPGYGSALTLKSVNEDGSMDFYTITDRGPNGDVPKYVKGGKKKSGKIFPAPAFNPNIGILHVSADLSKAEITDSIPLTVDGKKITGKAIPKGSVGSTKETAFDFNLKDLGTDPNGLDTEGIAVDRIGHFWISDEYGPFVVEADRAGHIIRKLAPGNGLPSILASRVPNRGSEGLTIDEKGLLVGFVQSPLDVEKKTKKTSPYCRIFTINPETGKTVMYAYQVDGGYKDFGKAKLGDIAPLGNNRFLVIEQGKQNKKMQNLIYEIDLTGATEIPDDGRLELGTLKNVKPVSKKLILDMRKAGWKLEKAEGLTLLPDRKTIAVVNDNDFGIAVDVIDSSVPKTDVEDYTYDADKKVYVYKDGKVHRNVRLGLKENDPADRHNEIWFFTLDEKL